MEANAGKDNTVEAVESSEVENAVKSAEADQVPVDEPTAAENDAGDLKSGNGDYDSNGNVETTRVDADNAADDVQSNDENPDENNGEKSEKEETENFQTADDRVSIEEKQDEKEKDQADENVEEAHINSDTEAAAAGNAENDAENADDDLPAPEPYSEPPADDPPSYEEQLQEQQQEEETPAEPEPEPEPERAPTPEAEPEPERVPTPEPVPVVTSHNYHPRLCIIRKWPDFQGYGFNLHAEKDKKGQYIGLVDANSPAEDADLRKGDRIIEVNGENIEEDTHQQVIQKIKAGGDVAKMLVVDNEADDYFKNNGIQVTSDMPEVITVETRQKESSAMTFIPRQCHVIKRPDFPGYGFNLHAEKERGGQYIGKIDDNSPAQEAGLREHDRIIEVNGENIEKETHQQVISRIKAGGDETKLLVVDREADNHFKGVGVTVTSSMPDVRFIQSTRPSPRSSAVTNGDSTPAPAPQPTRVEPVQSTEPAQANGGDFMSMNVSAKEMRERLARKKKNDPKQKSNMDFKSKYEIFQKM